MGSELSLTHLFLNASLLVQFVMLILLAASIGSWTLIFYKRKAFLRTYAQTENFEKLFWSGIDLTTLYKDVTQTVGQSKGMASVFADGFDYFAQLRKGGAELNALSWEGVQRSMRANMNRQLDVLEHQLPILATIGSISPYVGLFGTVWGIMSAFSALGTAQQATLAQVAPGIAEALFATAMGLFAAIPAVIAYNRFSTDLEALGSRYENFIEEFSAILLRYAAVKEQKD